YFSNFELYHVIRVQLLLIAYCLLLIAYCLLLTAYCLLLAPSYDRRLLAFTKASKAATTQPIPPVTTDSGAPISDATAPASTSPSCGPPMKKIILMEVIRPRK